MTYEEAIKVLDNTKVMILKGSGTDLAKASYMAVKALEKQIPKKPFRRERETFAMSKTGVRVYYTDYICSSCGAKLIYKHKYCECGQAIDWSDVDATND
jgi:hypothetical protein